MNLRGSGIGVNVNRTTTEGVADPGGGGSNSSTSPAPVTVTVEEEVRLSLKKIPAENHLYPDWREGVKGKVFGCGIPARESKYFTFLRSDERVRPHETEELMSTVNLENLNTKLYNEMMDVFQGNWRNA